MLDSMPEAPFDISKFDFSLMATQLRKLRDWTTYDLAEELGTSQPTVSRIEQKGHIPRIGVQTKLFNLFALSSVEFITKEGLLEQTLDFLGESEEQVDLYWQIQSMIEKMMEEEKDKARNFIFLGLWYSVMASFVDKRKDGEETKD